MTACSKAGEPRAVRRRVKVGQGVVRGVGGGWREVLMA